MTSPNLLSTLLCSAIAGLREQACRATDVTDLPQTTSHNQVTLAREIFIILATILMHVKQRQSYPFHKLSLHCTFGSIANDVPREV